MRPMKPSKAPQITPMTMAAMTPAIMLYNCKGEMKVEYISKEQ